VPYVAETSVCLGDQVVDLREIQVIGKPVGRVDSKANSRIGTAIEVLSSTGVLDEAHPAEIVVALLTFKRWLVSNIVADV
jgi:hypothetical protein